MYYLSVITITYNDIKGLIKTSNSILPLPENCEWIIIDGSSTDGTENFLNSLPKAENIKYISEKDGGIYDAMNKGILLSNGTYINFMNSGDSFIRDAFLKITSEKDNLSDIIMYDCRTVTDNGKGGYARKFPDNIDEIKYWACVQHQSTLISRKVFDRLGLYSLKYKYLSDYEHSVRAYLHKDVSFSLNPDLKLALFLLDGVSTSSKTALKIAYEYKTIQIKYFGKYNHKLFISNYIKYIIGYFPFSDFIIKSLKKLILGKR